MLHIRWCLDVALHKIKRHDITTDPDVSLARSEHHFMWHSVHASASSHEASTCFYFVYLRSISHNNAESIVMCQSVTCTRNPNDYRCVRYGACTMICGSIFAQPFACTLIPYSMTVTWPDQTTANCLCPRNCIMTSISYAACLLCQLSCHVHHELTMLYALAVCRIALSGPTNTCCRSASSSG
jgi:hypothetical protein